MSIAGINTATPGSNDNAGQGDDHIRDFKTAVKNCFGGVAGPVNNGIAGALATNVQLTALFDRIAALESISSNGLIIGEIRSFIGDYSLIPAGWYPCDGSSILQPAMTGRFLIGADSTSGAPEYDGAFFGGSIGAGGATGNQIGITAAIAGTALTVAQLPSGLPAALNVSHNSGNDGIQHTGTTACAGGEPGAGNVPRAIITGTGLNGATHTHSISGTLDHTHNYAASSTLPPWHAVYYIIYLGA